ncbi:hypothetical protein NT6N_00910 [Oceaniferula spumae]|uniref:Tetratricopeptide repeat protein n=1 Tax=Oceaniferula spumae TaxID=2979115 RepID=A0AAT9FGH6_9BACT
MKHHLTALLFTLSLTTPAWSQDAAPAADATKKTEDTQDDPNSPAVKMWQAFTNLPKEKRQEYGQKLLKTQNLFNQKRIFDALEMLDELDKIFPNHPAALNIRGACYVEIRAFDKANAIFEKVLEIAPKNTNVLFNLAEVDFVTKNWSSAHDRFEKLIPKLPADNKAMIRLCEFKLLLCKLKLDKIDEAKALMNKYDIWDDSPYYYYSRAAIAYESGDKLEAEKELRAVRFVWRNDGVLAPWQDTLIEFGYIRSFYGGETEDLGEAE